MSGLEPLLAAEAAAGATTAATTAAATAAAETAAAAYASAVPGLAAAGPGSQAAMLAAQTAPFGAGGLASTAAAGAAPGTLSSAYWNTISSALNPATSNGTDAARMGLQSGQANISDPFENFLRYGVDADMPGATMRSIQAGMQNAPLNTLGSLPQYLGAPAMPGGTKALQAAQLLNQPSQGQRTAYSPPVMNRGRQVTLATPVQSLLAEQPKLRRKPTLSLLG
jgi:hypothetical protein